MRGCPDRARAAKDPALTTAPPARAPRGTDEPHLVYEGVGSIMAIISKRLFAFLAFSLRLLSWP